LRAAGLAEATGAVDRGYLTVRLVGRVRDAGTGVLGWPSVLQLTATIREEVCDLVAAGAVPLLAGGCCTILPGALAGGRDALGAVGLAYLDGHLDLYDGRTSPTGEAADMPVSVVTGLGPAAWSAAVGAPLTRPGQLLLLGPRDRGRARADGSAMPSDAGLEPGLTPADLRARGVAEAGGAAASHLAAAGPYWVYLDVDILDETEFPATDYLLPGGLTCAELGELMHAGSEPSTCWNVRRLLLPRQGPSRCQREGPDSPPRPLPGLPARPAAGELPFKPSEPEE
jgi:arginase